MNAFAARRRALVLLASSALLPAARAQSRPLAFIVPQPAGNPTDGIARKLQPVLQKELGQTVLVENHPGAGGSLGVNKALASGADAQSLLITSQTESILTPLTMASARYKPDDLRCVALAGSGPYVLIGRADLPAANHAELVALARRSSGRPLSFAHIGEGSMIHLVGERWSRKVGAPLTHVPYKGVPPVVQDVLGGQVDLTFVPVGGPTVALLDSGKVRVYGSSGPTVLPKLPRVPLLSALDPALTDFVHTTWAAVFVPRTTPEAAVQRLQRALAVGLADADVQAYLDAGGGERPGPMSAADLDRFYQGETRLYQALARDLGVTAR
jgi:tripartite-type tricarboxylate transporter receptor subunit TctC